ncbi:MAG: SRPBCC family protein [Rhodospirillales bacterium]|jgi:carbon monoxide dehydrogenase subunit G
MDMHGSYDIAAPREAVWAALNDVEVLKACIPGCESITKHSDTELEATVSAKVGPVKAKFKGVVTLSDMDPPNGYTISGEGKGGAAGFAKGGAKVSLVEAGAGTTLTYEVKANVGGKLAQIGSRLIDSTAKKMANQFFSKFSEKAAALSAGDIEAGSTIKLKVPEAQEIAVSGTTQSGSFSPKTLQKLYSLNNFKPISFKIWLPIILGLFALGLIWTIFG